MSCVILFCYCFASAPYYFTNGKDLFNAFTSPGDGAMIMGLRDAIGVNYNIQIGAGISGYAHIKGDGPLKPFIKCALLSHQYIEGMDTLPYGTIVVLPNYSINNDVKKRLESKGLQVIIIDGVFSNKTIEKIKKEPDFESNPSIIFMLAGDVEGNVTYKQNKRQCPCHNFSQSKWNIFTKEMAMQIITKLPKDREIVILNGPRTGMMKNSKEPFSPFTKQGLDHITKSIKEFLKDIKNFKVFDCVIDKKKPESSFKSALKHCITNKNVILILGGESITMIYESLQLGIKPVVYIHDAMNEVHKKAVQELLEKNLIYNFDDFENLKNIADFSCEPFPNQKYKVINALNPL